MTPNMLRQLWSLIESSPSSYIHDLDDRGLINWLILQMDLQGSNSIQYSQDKHVLERYIREHLLLIRDIAEDTWVDDSAASAIASC